MQMFGAFIPGEILFILKIAVSSLLNPEMNTLND